MEWFLAIGLVLGMLMTFRWLYKVVTGERAGWWLAANGVCIGPLAARVSRWLFAGLLELPSLLIMLATPMLAIAALYLLLRFSYEESSRDAAIIAVAWLPISVGSVVLFIFMHPELFN